MEPGANSIVLNGQNVRGELRRGGQNVTCALEVAAANQNIDLGAALSTVRKDAQDFGTRRRDLWGGAGYRGQRQTCRPTMHLSNYK